jgi:hypothetical protein
VSVEDRERGDPVHAGSGEFGLIAPVRKVARAMGPYRIHEVDGDRLVEGWGRSLVDPLATASSKTSHPWSAK